MNSAPARGAENKTSLRQSPFWLRRAFVGPLLARLWPAAVRADAGAWADRDAGFRIVVAIHLGRDGRGADEHRAEGEDDPVHGPILLGRRDGGNKRPEPAVHGIEHRHLIFGE